MTSDTSTPSFETAFAELQSIVQRLEEGGLTLDEAMRLYEEGVRLVNLCTTILETAELRLVRLQNGADALPT
jgi:exodeoxyribonuclease VII small subunit